MYNNIHAKLRKLITSNYYMYKIKPAASFFVFFQLFHAYENQNEESRCRAGRSFGCDIWFGLQ